MNKTRYAFHEDFSGAGMARIGLGDMWECVRACDIDSKKCASYRANFNDSHLFEGSIADVKVAEAKPARLAWASFPCQDTSLAGVYAGLEGTRSSMFWKWMRIVKDMENAGKPFDLVCVENVRGLLTSNGGKDFAAIVAALTNAGYCVGAAIIDAVDFLPQSRERLFIIGAKLDKRHLPRFASKTPNVRWHPESMQSVYENIFSQRTRSKWFWLDLPEPSVKKPTLKQIITDEPEGVKWHTAAQTARLIELMSKENRRKLQKQKATKKRSIGMLYKRMRNGEQRAEVRFDDTAGCLRTAAGGSSRQTVMIVKGNKVRSRLISPREAAQLMGLPDTYKLPAKYNDAYQLCGDGVAVPVVRFLAEQVFEPFLAKIDKLKPKESLIATSA